MRSLRTTSTKPRRVLSLFDSTSLIVGIIIGVGIYQVAPDVAKGASNWWGVLLLWAAGGIIALCGALGYAELASAYPREGGDYVYLSRAYGNWAGFLFGWAQLVIVRPGDIAVIAFAFATYAHAMVGSDSGTGAWGLSLYAAAAVIILTTINIVGVNQAKWIQNLLTLIKTMGLVAILGVALMVPPGEHVVTQVAPLPLSLALIFVLFSYGGWNEMAYVAAEVKDPTRNIVRALVVGMLVVTVLYLLANSAFLYALGYFGMANSQAVATDTVSTVFPERGAQLISALICISALGAVNGLIFTGARISYAVGADHRVFRRLGLWHERLGTPVPALILQGVIAVILILVLGSFLDTLLYTAPAVYSFYLATSVAVFVLRHKEPHISRPYRVTGFPVPTMLFCVVCGYLIYSAVTYRPLTVAATLSILLLGLPLFWYSSKKSI